ncbi:MAG: MATE family efflux transporter [Bacteroidales bacterium]|nr:MATE family efflux transporter [Bacteroidales bacterium]
MKTTIKYIEIWKIAYPIILSSIVQNIISVTDTAFLGRVGKVELGASAIGGVFYLSLIMLGLGFAVGTQIIVARRLGEGKHSEIGQVVEHSHYFLVSLAILLILFMKANMPFIFSKILNSENIETATNDYLNYRIVGLLFAFVNHGFRAFYVGIAKTKVITWTTVFMAFVNVFLDYALVFGNLGFPQYGIKGAAIASVSAEIAACLFFIFFTIKRIDYRFYRLFEFNRFQFKIFKRIIKISFPTMMQNFISLTGWFFFFLFVEKMGEHSLAISNIIRSVYVVMIIPIWGFTSASNTLVSFIIGKDRQNEVLSLIIKVLKISVSCVLLIVVINVLMPELVLSIYTNDKSIIIDSIHSLYIVSVSSIFLTVGFVFFSGVSGTGMTKVSFTIEAFVIGFYVLATYMLTTMNNAKIEYVWTVEIFYGFIIAVISYLYIKYGNWQSKKI